ncbi:hypothetical protein ACFLZW_06095 [Chloroflexota bacterium]
MSAEELIQQAIEAAKTGDKPEAVRLLSNAVKHEPKNARVWYLLSQVVDDEEKARYCLEKVLEIEPGNEKATRRLEELRPAKTKKKGKNNLLLAMIGAFVVVCCIAGLVGYYVINRGGGEPIEVAGIVSTSTSAKATQEILPSETNTLEPTGSQTPTITYTPTASETPLPSLTPAPTDTPTIVPTPQDYSGQGDAVIDIAQIGGVGVLHIVGNASSGHFAVKNFAADGDYIDLLVNTTETYDGYRPINLWQDKQTVRLEITSDGPWKITLLPLAPEYVHIITAPGSYSGFGDDVLLLLGGDGPWVAKVIGNAAGHHLAVKSYGYNDYDLLVNTTDPYEGSGFTSDGIILFDVVAVGSWTIELSQ